MPDWLQYWDDPADAARPGEGTLLPLWRFAPGQVCGRAVTALAWNPRHWDLFAAGYGSFDPGKPVTGFICCHSLKHPDHPEMQLTLPSGVLSVDFHPAAPRLLAVGCADGSVHVVDVGAAAPTPLLRASSTAPQRHTDAVWEVKWAAEAAHGEPRRFTSVSSDGCLAQWEVTPGRELKRRDVFALHTAGDAMPGVHGASGMGYNEPTGCCCFDVHPAQPSLLLVGTQEGDALKCSTDCAPGKLHSYSLCSLLSKVHLVCSAVSSSKQHSTFC